MFVLLCILACALAAPQPQWNDQGNTGVYLGDLKKAMAELDKTMAEVSTEFRRTKSGWQGNHYNMNITLSGFDEKDITVKAMKGTVEVRAAHKEGNNENIYNQNDSLPQNVKADGGSWVYEGGVLKIVFPNEAAAAEPAAFKNKVEFVTERSGA